MEKGIIHRRDVCRFEKEVNGLVALVDYEISDGRLNVLRTYVPDPLRGMGLASELVSAAYEYADSEGLEPAAVCSYAVAWLKKNNKN